MPCLLPLDGPDPMTDARYPDRWLTDTRILTLTDRGHRLFVTGLVWSVSNRSDGTLTPTDLSLMQRVDTSAAPELLTAGLWRPEGDNYVITVFEQTQTSAAQLAGLETKKRNDAERQRRKRDRDASRAGVTRDTKDRTERGQATTGREVGTPTERPLRADAYDD